MRRLFLIVLLLLDGLFTASGAVAGITAEESGAAYEFLKTDIVIDGNAFKTTHHARLVILSPRGDDFASFVATEGRWSKIKDLKITVSDPDGQTIYTRDKGDLTKTCGFGGYSLYADICYFHAELKAPSYPFTIEYEYTTASGSLFELRGAPLQEEIPVDTAEIRLTMKPGTPIRWKMEGMDLEPAETTADGQAVYTWTATDLDGLEDIEYAPAAYREPARLMFMADRFKLESYRFEGGSWANVGRFYHDLAEDRYLPIKTAVNSLPREQQLDSLKAIYEEVINSTRYVSIQIGIGGWQPYAASLTQSRGYGDCKDLSTLLISRLRQAGITAYPALLSTRGERPTDPNFPTLTFNHVISAALIEPDTIWLDPTCGTCPLYEIPYQDEDLNLLLITDQGGLLTHTPAQTPENNLQRRDTRIFIDADRQISFETTIKYSGEYAKSLRYQIPHLTADEAPIFYRNRFADSRRKIGITSYSCENLEDINQPLVIHLTGRCTGKVNRIKNQLFCKPMFLDQPGSFETTTMNDRTLPINTYYPDRLEHHLTLQWADELAIGEIELPTEITAEAPFGSLSFAAKSDSLGVQLDFVKECDVYQIEANQLDQFRDFQSTLKKIAGQYITFNLSR